MNSELFAGSSNHVQKNAVQIKAYRSSAQRQAYLRLLVALMENLHKILMIAAYQCLPYVLGINFTMIYGVPTYQNTLLSARTILPLLLLCKSLLCPEVLFQPCIHNPVPALDTPRPSSDTLIGALGHNHFDFLSGLLPGSLAH